MKGPGLLATALLFRRMTKELGELNKTLRELAETQALALKLEAMKGGITLTTLREAEEDDQPAAGTEPGEPEVLYQTDGELAELELLEAAYTKAYGHPPGPGEDLLDILKRGGAKAKELRHAGLELELEKLGVAMAGRGEDRG